MMAKRDEVRVSDLDKPIKVNIRDHEHKLVDPPADFNAMTERAGWGNDPGKGRSVLLGDGREVLPPGKFAAPVGFHETTPVRDMLREMIAKELAGLKGSDEVDSPEDLNDFDEDFEDFPRSPYELVMVDEFPAVPDVKEAPKEAPPVVPPAAAVVPEKGA